MGKHDDEEKDKPEQDGQLPPGTPIPPPPDGGDHAK